jgi:hypothetical protein
MMVAAVPAGIGAGIVVSAAAPGIAGADLSECQQFNGMGPPGVYIETGYIPFGSAEYCPDGGAAALSTQSTLYKEDTANDTWTNIDPGSDEGALVASSPGSPVSVQSTWQCNAAGGYCYSDAYKSTYTSYAFAPPGTIVVSLPGCPANQAEEYIVCSGANYLDWTSATTWSIYGVLDNNPPWWA